MAQRKRGRPPIASEGSVCVSMMLPKSLYDATSTEAIRNGMSVSHVLRDLFVTNDMHGEIISDLVKQNTFLREMCSIMSELFTLRDEPTSMALFQRLMRLRASIIDGVQAEEITH